LNKEEIILLFTQKFGSYKVLFGTDFPVYNAKGQPEWVYTLPLSSEDRDWIFYKEPNRSLGL